MTTKSDSHCNKGWKRGIGECHGNVRQKAPYWRGVCSLSTKQAVKIREVGKCRMFYLISLLVYYEEVKKKRLRLEGGHASTQKN